MSDALSQLNIEALNRITATSSLEELDQHRVHYLGKKGVITEQLKQLGSLSPEERKQAGQQINILKEAVAAAIEQRQQQLASAALEKQLREQTIDVSLPVRAEAQGSIHPVTQIIEEITAILGSMGFQLAEGPDIENDFNNFTALNIPENHPARQMHDTFYLPKNKDGETLLLRTHTSPVQVRTMQAGKPPFRIIAPGRTYRCDSDMTHTPMFHQVEGLYIDKNIHFGHLKGCIIELIETIFEKDQLPIRFRPSFFPFTEPSAEVDIGCARGDGELKIGEGSDWLEVLGCGMVHPNVLHNVGIDPQEYQGFAFGLGVERFAMLKYGIPDLRTFFDGDVRWLEHYSFAPLDIPTLVRGLSQ